MSGTADFGHAASPHGDPAARPQAQGQPYWTVSTVLRMAREETGHGLRDVAAALRIRASQLHAIEEGRYHELPGAIYAVGFVRSYAEYLGLDAEAVVERFRQEIADLDRHTDLVFPAPVPEGRVPGGALLLLAVLLALAAYGGWYYMSSNERNLADLMPALPDRLAVLLDDGPAEAPVAPQDAVPAAPGSGVDDGVDPPPEQPAATGTVAPAPDGAGGDAASYHGSAANAAEAPLEVAVETPVEPVGEAEITALLAETPGRGGAFESTEPPARQAGGTAAAGERRAPSGEAAGTATEPSETRTGASVTASAPAALPDGGAAAAQEPRLAAARGGEATAPPPAAPDAGRRPAEPEVTVADAGAAPPPPPPAEAAEAGRAYGLDDAGRIVIRATADSWVQVNDRNGSLVMTRVLRPGDSYRVPDAEGLELVTGNAGGLRIFVDGDEAPPLGAPGTVLRDIPLDAERLRAGTARPN